MISVAKMVSMIICILLCVVMVAVPSWMIKQRSRKIETGLLGALGYGFVGYVWYYIFYIFIGVFLMAKAGTTGVLVQIFMTLISTSLTVLSLFWGIYLTNQKQHSIYRSAAVGIGFAFGKMAIELIYDNLYKFYFSLQINSGTFQADSSIRKAIEGTSTSTMYLDVYRCFLMFLLVFALALIMGHLYLQENVKKMAILAAILYETVTIINVFVTSVLPGAAASIAQFLFLTLVGVASGTILLHWFKTNKVVLNPLEIWKKGK